MGEMLSYRRSAGRAVFAFIVAEIITEQGRVMQNEARLIAREEDIAKAAWSLKVLSHPLRLKILCILGDGEASVQDMVGLAGTSQSNISQHLAILRDQGILVARREANRVYYRVSDQRTLNLIGLMREVFCNRDE